MSPEGEARAIDRVLARIEAGDADLDELAPALYDELRRLADVHMRNERPDHTLQPTALVNEAYMRCANAARGVARTRDRIPGARRARDAQHSGRPRARSVGGQADRAAQPSLVERARRGRTRGDPVDLLALNDALHDLGRLDPRQAEIVELSAFGGLTGQEIADRLGVHRNTIVSEPAHGAGVAATGAVRELKPSWPPGPRRKAARGGPGRACQGRRTPPWFCTEETRRNSSPGSLGQRNADLRDDFAVGRCLVTVGARGLEPPEVPALASRGTRLASARETHALKQVFVAWIRTKRIELMGDREPIPATASARRRPVQAK